MERNEDKMKEQENRKKEERKNIPIIKEKQRRETKERRVRR